MIIYTYSLEVGRIYANNTIEYYFSINELVKFFYEDMRYIPKINHIYIGEEFFEDMACKVSVIRKFNNEEFNEFKKIYKHYSLLS